MYLVGVDDDDEAMASWELSDEDGMKGEAVGDGFLSVWVPVLRITMVMVKGRGNIQMKLQLGWT